MNQTNTNWGHSVKTYKSSENVDIIRDKKHWGCSKLKEPKETWQVSEMHDPWLDSEFLKKVLSWNNITETPGKFEYGLYVYGLYVIRQ